MFPLVNKDSASNSGHSRNPIISSYSATVRELSRAFYSPAQRYNGRLSIFRFIGTAIPRPTKNKVTTPFMKLMIPQYLPSGFYYIYFGVFSSVKFRSSFFHAILSLRDLQKTMEVL